MPNCKYKKAKIKNATQGKQIWRLKQKTAAAENEEQNHKGQLPEDYNVTKKLKKRKNGDKKKEKLLVFLHLILKNSIVASALFYIIYS